MSRQGWHCRERFLAAVWLNRICLVGLFLAWCGLLSHILPLLPPPMSCQTEWFDCLFCWGTDPVRSGSPVPCSWLVLGSPSTCCGDWKHSIAIHPASAGGTSQMQEAQQDMDLPTTCHRHSHQLPRQKLSLSTASLVGSSYRDPTCFTHAPIFSLVLSGMCFHTSVSFPVPFPLLSEEYYWEKIVHQTLFRALEESWESWEGPWPPSPGVRRNE